MQGHSQLVRSCQVEASFTGTPRHSARRSRGLNQQPSGHQPTHSHDPILSQMPRKVLQCSLTAVKPVEQANASSEEEPELQSVR